jgi:hypothetical protein
VEELVTAQMKEGTTSCLIALDIGASTTLGTFALHTDWRKMMVVHMD